MDYVSPLEAKQRYHRRPFAIFYFCFCCFWHNHHFIVHFRFNRPPWPKVGNTNLGLLILRVEISPEIFLPEIFIRRPKIPEMILSVPEIISSVRTLPEITFVRPQVFEIFEIFDK